MGNIYDKCNILAGDDRVLKSSSELGDEIGVGESRVGCTSTDTESAQVVVVVCVSKRLLGPRCRSDAVASTKRSAYYPITAILS